MIDDKFLGISWEDRLENIIASLASAIPGVGGFISALIYLFWPGSQEDIWALIMKDVEHLVDIKILEEEFKQRKDEIESIKDGLVSYQNAKDTADKGVQMDILIGKLDLLRNELTDSKNSAGILPLTVTCSHIDLSMLRERLLHGKKYFPKDDLASWRSDLESALKIYRDHFTAIAPAYIEWRTKQANIHRKTKGWSDSNSWLVIDDPISGEKWDYKFDPEGYKYRYDNVKNLLTKRIQGEATASAAKMLNSTFYLSRYLPGSEKADPQIIPSLQQFELGPYCALTLGLKNSNPKKVITNIADKPGRITKIVINAMDASIFGQLPGGEDDILNDKDFPTLDMIHGLRFDYGDRQGNWGGISGGDMQSISVKTGDYFCSVNATFEDGVITKFIVSASDGSNFGETLGRMVDGKNALHKRIWAGSKYQLSAGKYLIGEGRRPLIPGEIYEKDPDGIATITLTFTHSSLDPSTVSHQKKYGSGK